MAGGGFSAAPLVNTGGAGIHEADFVTTENRALDIPSLTAPLSSKHEIGIMCSYYVEDAPGFITFLNCATEYEAISFLKYLSPQVESWKIHPQSHILDWRPALHHGACCLRYICLERW